MAFCPRIAILASVFLLTLLQVQAYPLEQTTDCRTSADCGVGECCVLGMMRYSTPQCLPMGQVEDFCREESVPENRTLFYPNGDTIDVYDIYTHVCPCDSGLQCVDNTCSQGSDMIPGWFGRTVSVVTVPLRSVQKSVFRMWYVRNPSVP